ncbi:hypothetical protein CF319_g4428 [Tilletia indica]|nr:hypothetical protein CF319_g4428 [Tilletia indica]
MGYYWRTSLLLLITLLTTTSLITASSSQTPSQLTTHFQQTYTPSQAYTRALYLLDSLISHPHPPPPSQQDPELQDTRREYHSAHWDAFQAWGPLGTFLRLSIHTRNTIQKYISSSSKSTTNTASTYIPEAATHQEPAAAGDDTLIYGGKAGAGSTPVQLWPWWDGRGDTAIAGPWIIPDLTHQQLAGNHIISMGSTSSPTSSSSILTDPLAALLSKLNKRRSRKDSKRSASSNTGNKPSPLQKAQSRRAEAIALLEWVAFDQVSPDYDDILARSSLPIQKNALNNALNRNKTHLAFRTSSIPTTPPSTSEVRASALWVLAEHSLWGTHAASPHLPRAKAAYEVLAWEGGNATAHLRLGFLEGSGWGRIGGPGVGSGKVWGVGLRQEGEEGETEAEEGLRQARALLHYELAASAPEPVRANSKSSSSANGSPFEEKSDKDGKSSGTSYSSRTSAQMALGFRYLSGIGTPMDCMKALNWYEVAAKDAYARYLSGPPKGLTLPYTHLRLSDVQGGAYGPGASAASSGYAASRPHIKAVLESRAGSGAMGEEARLRDLLEYYEYQAEPVLKSSGVGGRSSSGSSLGKKLTGGGGGELGGGGVRSTSNAAMYALELARFYYGGSLWAAGESAGKVERDFERAREYALRVARRVWPLDAGTVRRGGPSGPSPRSSAKASSPTGSGKQQQQQLLEGEDMFVKVDEQSLGLASRAAGMLGWMYLRGEGVPQDFKRAWVWFSRGSSAGDSDCHNGLGVMIRDGYGVKASVEGAVPYFTASAQPANPSPDGLVNMGRLYYDAKDFASAARTFKSAMHLLEPFESYLWHGKIDALLARAQSSTTTSLPISGPTAQERCDSATLNLKHAVERADWADPVSHRADRAWRRGDGQRALLGWMLAGEMGYEAAQNNVAWILDRDKHRLQIPSLDSAPDSSFDRLALVQWTRSAGQENVDALVKMGDYYFRGMGTPTPGIPSYEKAVACYSAAADMSGSALAYWNMGWMYESGLGVGGTRDFHLAKRYYDMAWNTNRRESYLAVVLSLAKLHLRAGWAALVESDASALAMFESYARGLDTSMPLTEAEEEKAKAEAGAGQKAKKKKERMREQDVVVEEPGAGDPYIPETYDRRRPTSEYGYNEDDGFLRNDDRDQSGTGTGTGSAEEYELDLFEDFEGLILVLAIGFLGFLVWYRRRIHEAREGGAGAGVGVAMDAGERARRERIEAAREVFRARGEDVGVPPPPAAAAGAGAGADERVQGGGEGEGGDWARRRRGFVDDGEEREENDPAWFNHAM